MAIQPTQTPSITFDMAYGANPITLEGITVTGDKYALRIYIVGQSDPIADIRQTPNKVGKAIFDIQNILQSYIAPSANDIDGLHYSTSGFAQQNTRMRLSGPTLLQYQFAYAEESNGVVGSFTTDPRIFTAINGSKQYFQVPFNTDNYIAKMSGVAPADCTFATRPAGPLSDNQWTIADTETGDNFLTYNGGYSSPGGIDVHNVYPNDQCTKTFYQKVERNATNLPVAQVQGIEAFHVLQVNAAGSIFSSSVLAQTQSSGGGPNLAIGQGTQIAGQSQIITLASGPANFPIGVLSPLCTHYYIVPVCYTPPVCITDEQSQTPISSQAAYKAQRYNVLTEPCNDYPHIQFAWQNSLGYRDQFTFTKRVEHKTRTKNNNFLKGAADYNSSEYSVDIQDRGYTTYSQKIDNDFMVMSGYMNDAEAELLKYLHQSAEVKVRFSDGEYANQWVPVTILKTAYTEKTIRKDKLFQYSVSFRLASNIKAMRG
jgi:hypothetical protein